MDYGFEENGENRCAKEIFSKWCDNWVEYLDKTEQSMIYRELSTWLEAKPLFSSVRISGT